MKKYVLGLLLAVSSALSAGTTYVDSSVLNLTTSTGKSLDYSTTYKLVSEGDSAIAMSIHDRPGGVVDEIADGVFGVNPGPYTGREWANWNFEVYVEAGDSVLPIDDVNGTKPGYAYVMGTIDFQSYNTSEWDSYTVDMKYHFDYLPVGNLYIDSRNLYFSELWPEKNVLFDYDAEGIYTIEVTYGSLTNSIEVQVGEAPAVPAPAALLLTAMGTGIVGRIRRRMA